jgi:hypothetical protein
MKGIRLHLITTTIEGALAGLIRDRDQAAGQGHATGALGFRAQCDQARAQALSTVIGMDRQEIDLPAQDASLGTRGKAISQPDDGRAGDGQASRAAGDIQKARDAIGRGRFLWPDDLDQAGDGWRVGAGSQSQINKGRLHGILLARKMTKDETGGRMAPAGFMLRGA